MPPKRATNKSAAPAAVRAVPARIEIRLPSMPVYVPGGGPPSAPISLAPAKDSTAYILDKYVLPKLSECGPNDRRLVYYLVGFRDLPVVRILIPCHKAQEYVDPRTIEDYEFEQDQKLAEERRRLKEEAAKRKKKGGRPAKIKGGPAELDYSKPSPHGTVTTPTPIGNESEENTLLLETQLAGPSLSTPQKRSRPLLEGGAGPSNTSTTPFTSASKSTANRRSNREEEAVKRQLFYESTKHRLSPSYSPPAGTMPLRPVSGAAQSASGPSSRASTSAGLPAPSVASSSSYRTRGASRRSGHGSAASDGSPQIHPDWAQIMKFSNKVMDVMDKKAPEYDIQPRNAAATTIPFGSTANNTNNPVALHPALATSWGGANARFPLPNAQGFLPSFSSPAPSAPSAPESSRSQKDKKRTTTETGDPDTKPKKKQRTSNPKPPKKEASEEAWSVKHLLRDELRYHNGRRVLHYLVQWTGDYAPSWEPASNIIDKELVRDYKARKEAGTLPPLPANAPYSTVDEAFRGDIDDQDNQGLVREEEEEEEEQLWVTDPATTPLPGGGKKRAPVA